MGDFVLRARWPLYILPVLALAYFVGVLVLIATDNHLKGVSNDALALAGVVVFLVVALIELPFLFRRREPRPEPAGPAPAGDAIAAPRARIDDEYLVTSEEQQGLKVLEYSTPAKSRHHGAVYTKAYVPVTKEHVLRIETLAAEGAEL